MKESYAYLSGGSNLGDRKAHLRRALDGLSAAGVRVVQVSSVYETEPVGIADQPWFLNIAARVATRLAPRALLDLLLEIEASHGRVRDLPGGPRTLDLDILLYEDLILQGLPKGKQIGDHGHLFERLHGKDPFVQVRALERHGLGSRQYDLVEVE